MTDDVEDSSPKRSRLNVAAIDILQKLDYSTLENLEELDYYNKTAYDAVEVRKAKAKGLSILDEYEVYSVHQREEMPGDAEMIDTTWAVTCSDEGTVKCRLVGREYAKGGCSTRQDLRPSTT